MRLTAMTLAVLVFGASSLAAEQPSTQKDHIANPNAPVATMPSHPEPNRKPGAPVDVEFKADVDGSNQRYVEMLPAEFQADHAHDVLIALHGHGSDRWQYIRADRGECKAARDVAAKHSMVFISPDYRASTSWMGPKPEADLVQTIGLLRKKHQVRRTYLCGASMGGTSVLIFAALHPDLVDGVSSQNGTANMVEYQHFLDAIAISYGGDKKQKPDEYRNRSAELFPEKFTMPVSFTVGGRDSTVEPHSVRRLSQKLLQINKDILIIDRPAGGHITNYEDTEAALEFIIKASQACEREQTPTSGEAGGETRDSRK